eukprot:2425437-Prymnesium_polylepis.1
MAVAMVRAAVRAAAVRATAVAAAEVRAVRARAAAVRAAAARVAVARVAAARVVAARAVVARAAMTAATTAAAATAATETAATATAAAATTAAATAAAARTVSSLAATTQKLRMRGGFEWAQGRRRPLRRWRSMAAASIAACQKRGSKWRETIVSGARGQRAASGDKYGQWKNETLAVGTQNLPCRRNRCPFTAAVAAAVAVASAC